MYSTQLQQSPVFGTYVSQLGWHVLSVDDASVFIKRIPFMGTLAKIQRPTVLPYLPKLIPILLSHRVTTVSLEPTEITDQHELDLYVHTLSGYFRIYPESFLPTKTIVVPLTGSEDDIFKSFTEAKRRAVRRAKHLGVIIQESASISDLIAIKSKSAGTLGSITTFGARKLWDLLWPEKTTILLALKERVMIGGVMLIFHGNTAYYWIAGATKPGKKLFAPTLLVWESLKRSKAAGMETFDFLGVFDERCPKQFTSWKGFTRFKEGFGGQNLYYPLVGRSSPLKDTRP